MATVEATSPSPALGPRDRRQIAPLITPTFVGVLVTMYLPLCNFYLLLSALPALVSSNGAGHSGAGLTTGVLMAATTIAELAVPFWALRWGYRRLTQVALLLLALPTLALWLSFDMTLGLLVSVVRGVGLEIAFVISSSIVAHVTVPSRRAEALALSGALSGTAAIICTPAGVWIAARFGPDVLIGISTLVVLGGFATVAHIPVVTGDARATGGRLSMRPMRALLAPALSLALTAIAAAIFITFAPLMGVPSASAAVPAALLVHSCSTLFARWASGRLSYSPSYMLCAAGMLAGVGLVAVSCASHLPIFLLGAALTGLAFGAAQNVSLVWMFNRASPAHYDGVSAIWNIAYDGGLGLGAAAFGFVLTPLGHQHAFLLTGALLVILAAGVPLALRKGELDGPNIGTTPPNAPNGARDHGISVSQLGAPQPQRIAEPGAGARNKTHGTPQGKWGNRWRRSSCRWVRGSPRKRHPKSVGGTDEFPRLRRLYR
jgi:predicted MFS family arabinose efflux permease